MVSWSGYIILAMLVSMAVADLLLIAFGKEGGRLLKIKRILLLFAVWMIDCVIVCGY